MLLTSGTAGHLLFLTILVLFNRAGGVLQCWDLPVVPPDDTEYEDSLKLPRLEGTQHRSLNNVMEYHIKTGGNIELNCDKDIIYNLTLKTRTGGNRKCGGLTPELLTSSKNCIWKNSCNVTYEPRIIMFPDPECFGVEPYFLELSYSCLKFDTAVYDVKNTHQVIESESGILVASKSLKGVAQPRRYRALIRPPPSMKGVRGVQIQVIQADIKNGYSNNTKSQNGLPTERKECTNTKMDEKVKEFPIIKETTSKSYKGILRSHARFPWNYRRPLGTRHLKEWTSFYHRLEAPTTGQDLLIKVVNFDLDPRDTLQFKVGKKVWKMNKTDVGKLTTHYKCKKLEVTFKVQHGSFTMRSGFLIHYEWIPKSKPKMFKGPLIYDKKSERSDVDITSTTPRTSRLTRRS